MKEKFKALFRVDIVVLFVVLSLIVVLGLKDSDRDLGFAAQGFNVIDVPTHTATSTSATLPTLLMERNPSRIYGLVVNDSDTIQYIHFVDFDSANAASSTVNRNEGIRLNANGGSYEILPENMIISDVWVATSTAGKVLLVTEE